MDENESIGQRTKQKLTTPYNLSFKKKRAIRMEGVVNYIRSQYAGKRLSTIDLIRAAGYTPDGSRSHGYWNGITLLNRMQDLRIINRNHPGANESAWTILADGKKTPGLQDRVQDEDSDIDELIPDKPYEVSTDEAEDSSTPLDYSFELTFSKRGQSGDFGRIRMGQLEMTDVTIDTARKMINELMDNLS